MNAARRGAARAAIALALLAGCATSRPDVLALFPDGKAPGAPAPASGGKRYEGMEATAVIDGGIVSYQEFGFRSLAVRDYRAGGAEIAAEIYEMEDPAAAFGAYALGRDAKREFADLGEQGWIFRTAVGANVAEFWKGAFYVRVEEKKGSSREAVLALGKAIAARIPRGGGVPAPVLAVRIPGIVPNSEKYFRGPLAFEQACPELPADVAGRAGPGFEGASAEHPLGRVFVISWDFGMAKTEAVVRAIHSDWKEGGPAPGGIRRILRTEGESRMFGAFGIREGRRCPMGSDVSLLDLYGIAGGGVADGLDGIVRSLRGRLSEPRVGD